MQPSDYYLKLRGKVAVPEPLELDWDYVMRIKGSIVGEDKVSNQNGEYSQGFTFEPLEIEIYTPNGLTLKADKRKQSQKIRWALKRKWETLKEPIDFEEYYLRETGRILREIDASEA